MQKTRTLLHEILNALAIARGYSETIQANMKGEINLNEQQKLEKIERAIKAMDRIELATQEIRNMAVNEKME